ncbi:MULTISPECIES: DUF1573 domain-containing protein [Sphingobacterium]|uniref:DUF1573 domain-containing protein n=1 Tax=Sphingobacterium TaxID=28453 RepID=UPI0013DA3592|nr:MULTISPECIES: DUF1573 domain-containing protein [unclassified Sphingobacterium]
MIFKNTLLAISILGFMASCSNQGDTNANKGTTAIVASVSDSTGSGQQGTIEFENSVFDFGKVKEGAVVEHIFKFTNTGKAPVILSQVSASCGCTTPDFTKEPILPGKTGEIRVSFNSLGQVGTQQKIVTISSNAEPRVTTVQIKGVVEK